MKMARRIFASVGARTRDLALQCFIAESDSKRKEEILLSPTEGDVHSEGDDHHKFEDVCFDTWSR